MYGMPANSAESQLLEAWPASQCEHLRESADLLRICRENQLVLVSEKKGNFNILLCSAVVDFSTNFNRIWKNFISLRFKQSFLFPGHITNFQFFHNYFSRIDKTKDDDPKLKVPKASTETRFGRVKDAYEWLCERLRVLGWYPRKQWWYLWWNIEYEDDLLELTRLMSQCDIPENTESSSNSQEDQLNLAGMQYFSV